MVTLLRVTYKFYTINLVLYCIVTVQLIAYTWLHDASAKCYKALSF